MLFETIRGLGPDERHLISEDGDGAYDQLLATR
jgi:hypothetical protein